MLGTKGSRPVFLASESQHVIRNICFNLCLTGVTVLAEVQWLVATEFAYEKLCHFSQGK